MLAKRIIPCLDVKDGQTVKGINFVNLRYAGDPVELARRYDREGADELVFLDITATNEARQTMLNVVEAVAKQVFIPLAVGGGIRTIDDIRNLLCCGADKVSLNTAAVKTPELIEQGASAFGSQCITVAVDSKKEGNDFYVYINAGQKRTDWKVLDWVKEVEKLGAGEILLTSMDADGTQAGYDLDITKLISENTNLPVIASGGASKEPSTFYDVLTQGSADAALAASVFHFNTLPIKELKHYLNERGVTVRL
jgi:cyclase